MIAGGKRMLDILSVMDDIDDIARLAEEGVRVVTSDRGLGERVRGAGGEVEGVSAFRERLGETSN